MHINEAVKQALEVGGEIYRESAKLDYSDIYATIKPTNSYDTCILIIMGAKGNKRSCRNWNPTAEDLIADDWKVLGNETKNSREDWIEKQNKKWQEKKEKNITHKTARKVIGAIILIFCAALVLGAVTCVVGIKVAVLVALAAFAYATLVDIGIRLLH